MRVDFYAVDEQGGDHIAGGEWPCVPRVGETVWLMVPGKNRHLVPTRTEFLVRDVHYAVVTFGGPMRENDYREAQVMVEKRDV